jgi:hypothetical protein
MWSAAAVQTFFSWKTAENHFRSNVSSRKSHWLEMAAGLKGWAKTDM